MHPQCRDGSETSLYTCRCFIRRFIWAASTTCINSVYFTSAQPPPNAPPRGERIIGITKGNINIHNGKSFRNAFYNHYTLKWNWAKPRLSAFRSWILKDIIPYLCYYHTSHDQDVCSQPEYNYWKWVEISYWTLRLSDSCPLPWASYTVRIGPPFF